MEVPVIRITEEMQRLINDNLADGCPCILATASPSAEPGVSFRGSMMVLDEQSLAYWDRTQRAGLQHVETNPQVVVMYRNPKEHRAWKFHGEATVYTDGPIRQQVMARVVQPELDNDLERRGFAVVVKLSSISTLGGQLVQKRD